MNVQIINKSKHPLPAYATELSAGMDIRANLSEPISLAPMQRCLCFVWRLTTHYHKVPLTLKNC